MKVRYRVTGASGLNAVVKNGLPSPPELSSTITPRPRPRAPPDCFLLPPPLLLLLLALPRPSCIRLTLPHPVPLRLTYPSPPLHSAAILSFSWCFPNHSKFRHHRPQQHPPWKKPCIKLERDRATNPGSCRHYSGDRGRSEGNASSRGRVSPREARRTRRWSQPGALGEEAGGGTRGADGGVNDQLAPYDRIEAETWDDEGLEELLHGSRREGYLDLRRYRKPGWPRPLRVTRLEASHGKRYVECFFFIESVVVGVFHIITFALQLYS